MDWRVLQGISRAALEDRAHQEQIDAAKRDEARRTRSQFESYLTTVANHPQMPDAAKTTAMHAMLDTVTKGDKVDDKHYQKWSDALWRSTLRPAPYTQGEQTAMGMNDAAPGIGAGLNALAPGAGTMFESVAGDQATRIPAGADRPQVSGMLSPEEVAASQGRAARIQMDAMTGGGGMSGSGSNVATLPNMRFDSRGRPSIGMTSRLIIPQQKNYILKDGSSVVGLFDPGTMRIHDAATNADITSKVQQIERAGGVRWAQSYDPTTGNVEYQALSSIAAPGTKGPQAPVRLSLGTTTDEAGNVITTTRDPYTGRVAAPGQQVGTRQNASLVRRNLEASLNLKGLSAQEKENAIQLGSLKAYGTYTDGTYPSWVQTDDNGNPVPLAVSPGARPTAVGQNKAQAAALGLHIIGRIEPIVGRLESQFGPISGDIQDWVVKHGLENNPDVKDLQILATHLSASLPAIQQFRSGVIMKDYHSVLGGLGQPFENFKSGLASTKGVLDEAFNEGVRPVTPRTTSSRLPLTGTNTGTGTSGKNKNAAPDPALDVLRKLATSISARP